MDWTYLHYIRQLLEASLADDPAAKQRALLAIQTVANAPARSAHEQMAHLIDILGRELSDPIFGFQLIEATPLTSYGNGGLAIHTAPDLRAALDLIVNYSEIALLLYFFDYRTEDGQVHISIHTRYPLHEGYEIGVGAVSHSANQIIGHFTNTSKNLIHVRTKQLSPELREAIQAHTGATVETGADNDEIVFPAALLDLKNAQADPITHGRLIADLETDLASLHSVDLREFVRMRVRAEIAAPPSQSTLAKDAKMSERSFRHALSKQGTSYQEIVRVVRLEYAETELRNGHLSIAEIGYRLGFTDPSNFTSSFKRWTGQTPKKFVNGQ